jgi:hypothetical protein
LKLSPLARDLDDGKYALSWYEGAEDGAPSDSSDTDGTGAGLTSHL